MTSSNNDAELYPERNVSSPLVSVVVPAYNNGDYLAETMRSVLDQTYPHLEVVVADHASKDDTWEVMEQFGEDSRVTLLRTDAGGGALRNWNRVSQAATGEFIKLVCGDDLLYPNIVAEQVAALIAHPTAVLAASPRDIIDARGEPVVRGRGLAGLSGLHSGARAVRKTVTEGSNIFGEPGCVLIRRETLERIGWWDSRWPYLIDETTFSMVLLEGDFVGVPRTLAGFRISDSQWSVRLLEEQSSQAAAFHDWLHSARPDVVRSIDRVTGNARARIMARVRRFAYIWLGRRMSKEPAAGAA